jgi:hypothetical protein
MARLILPQEQMVRMISSSSEMTHCLDLFQISWRFKNRTKILMLYWLWGEELLFKMLPEQQK